MQADYVEASFRKGVSMKSGLEDRNNQKGPCPKGKRDQVSMKSGLEDRNNRSIHLPLPS